MVAGTDWMHFSPFQEAIQLAFYRVRLFGCAMHYCDSANATMVHCFYDRLESVHKFRYNDKGDWAGVKSRQALDKMPDR